MQTYSYTNEQFTSATKINTDKLHKDVVNASLSSATFYGLSLSDNGDLTFTVDFLFSTSLSSEDNTSLDNIVSTYTYSSWADTIATVKDKKDAGYNGGTFTSGSWIVRNLNYIEGDVGFVNISANQFTLDDGKYNVIIKAPACNVRNHQIRLHNVTDDTYIMGSNAYAWGDVVSTSDLHTSLNISVATTYEIQHICFTTCDNIGFGRSTGFSSEEIYTIVVIQQY